MAAGLVAVFFVVPTDAFQGVAQRIFYVHVPTAWVAYLAFAVVLIGSIAYLKTGSRRWDSLAHASAEAGVLFTGLNLLTGMLWGRPIWGTYWTWDARLTTTFVLFLVYVGYLVFRSLATDATRGARVAAVIGIVGFVDVPLVHFSVDWWRTLHPARTVLNVGGAPQLPASMLITMLWMLVVFTGLYAVLITLRMRLDAAEEAVSAAEEAAEAEPAHPRALTEGLPR
jgi:heme exporter protein C